MDHRIESLTNQLHNEVTRFHKELHEYKVDPEPYLEALIRRTKIEIQELQFTRNYHRRIATGE